MPSIKDLKKRIGSVKNTQQTTRAMKMVSAAKLRRAQDAIQSQRPYARKIGELIGLAFELSKSTPGDLQAPILERIQKLRAIHERRLLLVVITSDRGLCGGFNSNVIKTTQRWISENHGKYTSLELAFVGKKGYDFFRFKRPGIRKYFSETGGKVTFAKAKALSDALVGSFVDGEVDEIKLIYNEFKNAVTQKVIVEDFLPLPDRGQEMGGKQKTEAAQPPMYLVRPSLPGLLDELLAKNFAIQSFRVLLESQASEHGARMSAMENATKNAGEMIRKLTLQYNKQRQAGITKELLEIIAGSESQRNTG